MMALRTVSVFCFSEKDEKKFYMERMSNVPSLNYCTCFFLEENEIKRIYLVLEGHSVKSHTPSTSAETDA